MSEITTPVQSTVEPKAKATKLEANGHFNLDPRLKAGQTLKRVYKDKTYEVKVTKAGFIFNGQTRSSLSQIAREIIGGTQVNGFLFFKVGGTAPTSRTRKGGLRTGQVRLLQVLAKLKGPISRSDLASRAKYANPGIIGPLLGVADPDLRKKEAYPSLLTLKLVDQEQIGDKDAAGSDLGYTITAKGRAALKAAKE